MEDLGGVQATKENRILIWGVIYFLVLGLLIWLGYGWRMIQIQRQKSLIQSIKKEVYSQIDEESLNKLESRVGQLATLYGQPVATKLLKDIEKSIPKNVTLSSIQIEGRTLVLRGTTSDYRAIPLFATALSEQSKLVDAAEVKEAGRAVENEQVVISFVLEANLK